MRIVMLIIGSWLVAIVLATAAGLIVGNALVMIGRVAP